jgi:multidrug efflux pump subunit AcrA (membrane-fusion protein)
VEVNGELLPATVIAVTPEVDAATRTRAVVLSLDVPSAAQLAPGQLVRMEVQREVPTQGFWLPSASLARGSHGLWNVYSVNPDGEGFGKIVRRDVEVLHTEEGRVLVRGALDVDDRIVSQGTHRIVVGQRVRAGADETSSPARQTTTPTELGRAAPASRLESLVFSQGKSRP